MRTTKGRFIQTFLTNADEEIDVEVKNVSLAELTSPYKASVDFEKRATRRARARNPGAAVCGT